MEAGHRPYCPGSIFGHCPTPGAHFPRGRVSRADESSSHPCRRVSSDGRPAPLPCPPPSCPIAATVHHHHHQTSHLQGLFLQALPAFLHTHFSADALPDLKVPFGDHSMWSRDSMLKTSSVRKAHSCDPQLQGGRHPPASPFTIPPPERISGCGRRGAPPCHTEAPSPGRTWAGTVPHSAVPPVSPEAGAGAGFPPGAGAGAGAGAAFLRHPPLPPFPATSSLADWPPLRALRNSHSNKVLGPPILGWQPECHGFGGCGYSGEGEGSTAPWKRETWKEGALGRSPRPPPPILQPWCALSKGSLTQ